MLSRPAKNVKTTLTVRGPSDARATPVRRLVEVEVGNAVQYVPVEYLIDG